MSTLRISTMTGVSELSCNINLDALFDNIRLNKYIKYIEYGIDENGSKRFKGYSKKNEKKVRKQNKRNIFFNQATLHILLNKIINVKVFNNGKIQMTGLLNEGQIKEVLDIFTKECISNTNDIFTDGTPQILCTDIVLINSDFDMGFEINREVLHSEILNSGIYSSYEPCIYPGVNIKYFINTNNWDGICCCENRCDGKGRANGDGDCKKMTIAVFKSGKIIITGGQNTDQLETAYYFIKEFIEEKKELFMLT